MSGHAEVEAFAASLREIALSLSKKRFWTLLRESMAHPSDAARQEAMARAAAAEVARLSEPSARIELNGHSASSLLRAIAEAGNVDPPAFEGLRGRGPDDGLIQISPFVPADALFAFAWKRKDEEATFVHGYFNFTAGQLMEWLGLRHGKDSPEFQRMASFVAHAQAATPEPSLPPLVDAIVGRLRLSGCR